MVNACTIDFTLDNYKLLDPKYRLIEALFGYYEAAMRHKFNMVTIRPHCTFVGPYHNYTKVTVHLCGTLQKLYHGNYLTAVHLCET